VEVPVRSETQGRGQPLPFTIVVDAGHGGHERAGRSTPYGVRGPGGLLEKDVTLGLAQRVAAQLGSGVVLTRHGDVNPSLAERAAITQRCGAGVFLSLHANGSSGRRRGAEAWVHRRAGAPSRALAAALGRELATLGGPQPGLAQEDLAVLTPERLPRGAAACLLEVDYLSDPDGEARLREPHALDHLAGAIVRAVRRYGEARALDDPGALDGGTAGPALPLDPQAPADDGGGGAEPLDTRTIPASGLVIPVNTAQAVVRLGRVQMTKHHLFVVADIHIEPDSPDADRPRSFSLTPGEDFPPPQPGQNGTPGQVSRMRWYNLGPSTYSWSFYRGLSFPEEGKPTPVRSSLVGTLTFTESDTWPVNP
jgi:N-acetylmuramoyl-L-alanine amidase